jgi:phosphotransferase system  glucose/maltose/N-acetylglucosamine-specific IIC component
MSFFGFSAILFAFLFFLETVPSMTAQNSFITSLLYLSLYSLLFAGEWRRNPTLYSPAMVALVSFFILARRLSMEHFTSEGLTITHLRESGRKYAHLKTHENLTAKHHNHFI